MPGLFDNGPYQGAGLLGGIGNFLSNIAGAGSPAIQENNFRRQGSGTVDQMMGPGMGPLFMGNPAVGQMMLGQRNLAATIDALTPQFGRDRATLFAMHPELLGELAKPQAVEPGSSLQAPLNLLGPTLGAGAAPTSQQQQPPSSQPGPSNASVGGGGAYQSQTNLSGVIDPATARRAAEQWVLGDASALQNAGFSKLGQIGRVAVQNEITKVMGEQGLTNEDVMQRQSRFPAVKKAVDKLYGAQASMGQAGIEFQKLFPQFMADLQKYGATQYPDANKFFQFIDAHRGDPNVAPLAQRMITLSNVYGRAVSQNPASANTDYKHREFAQALNQFWPLAATQRIGDAMNQEIQTAHDSVGKEVNRLFVDNGLGRKPDAATLADAKAALARGHSRADVTQRLSEHGFSGDGL